jgi:cyclase
MILDISGRGSVDHVVVNEIQASRISTPLAYGGGIQAQNDVDLLLKAGCERFVLETMLFRFPERIHSLAEKVGAQALIASLPLYVTNGYTCQVKHKYAARWGVASTPLDAGSFCRKCNDLPVAEVLAIDSANEGTVGRFSLVTPEGDHPLADLQKGIIWFGGIDAIQATKLLELPSTVAVGFGNMNFEKEVAMGSLRRCILRSRSGKNVRKIYGIS